MKLSKFDTKLQRLTYFTKPICNINKYHHYPSCINQPQYQSLSFCSIPQKTKPGSFTKPKTLKNKIQSQPEQIISKQSQTIQSKKKLFGRRTESTTSYTEIKKTTPEGVRTDSMHVQSTAFSIKTGDKRIKHTAEKTIKTQQTVKNNPSDPSLQISNEKKTQKVESNSIHLESSNGIESRSIIREENSESDFSKSNDVIRDKSINFSVGNPTKEEIEWRKKQLTPHALIIHPNRLLPSTYVDKEYKSKTFWNESFKNKWRQIHTFFKKNIVGEEKYEQYERTIKEGYDDIGQTWEETQNPYLVRLRSAIDRMNLQTESSRALEICQEEFGNDFWTEDFVPEFGEKMLPIIVRAYFNDDLNTINKFCIGEAKLFCEKMIEHRVKNKIQLPENFLWIDQDNISVEEIKLSKDKLPQIVITCVVQTIDCAYERGTNKVIEGSPSLVASNYFLLTLEPNMNEEYLKVSPLPWQIRTLQTQKQRQLV